LRISGNGNNAFGLRQFVLNGHDAVIAGNMGILKSCCFTANSLNKVGANNLELLLNLYREFIRKVNKFNLYNRNRIEHMEKDLCIRQAA